jgi:hypothetical protein
LPFFSCPNVFLEDSCQEDIGRFIYSKEFSVPPYIGAYGDQPRKWIEKSFIINSALETKEYQEQKKAQQRSKSG